MSKPAELTLPAGAWDCHVHVVGAHSEFPMVADRQYTAGPATVDDLKQHLSRNGLAHAVIVQPSFYGTDGSCTNDALRQMEGRARGIAVLPADVSRQQMRELDALGIRGIRINLESSAVRDTKAAAAALELWAKTIAEFGWHIQVYAAPQVAASMAEQIDRLPVKLVFDHFAMIAAATATDDRCLQTILALLKAGNTYVKLSAPYRISAAPLDDVDNIARLARLFFEANPERVLWGTDWPHTNRESGVHRLEVSRYRDIPASMLTQALWQWQDQPGVLAQILVANPRRLYA
jgi:predicted TIM-barrel fold metal-dependent hydrolase